MTATPDPAPAKKESRGTMATKVAAAATTEDEDTREREESTQDGPLMDNINTAVKNLIKKGKERGFLTYDEVNAALPQEEMSSEQIEDIMSALNEMGVNVVENEDDGDQNTEKEESDGSVAGNVSDEDVGRTDDPVRMYLREMGSVELLSREGEIAIAKRIEAGREMMIGGICESPLTMRALVTWRDQLKEGGVLLRDVIDLEATYGAEMDTGSNDNAEEGSEDGAETEGEDEEEGDGEENNLSLSAMEQQLLPQVLETFDKIADTYGKLSRMQKRRIDKLKGGEELARTTERKYEKLKGELIEAMESVRLHNGRIEALVEQLYTLNRRLSQVDIRLWKMADSAGVPRKSFMDEHFGNELEPDWLDRRTSTTAGSGLPRRRPTRSPRRATTWC
jgi:RNA polymerase primary sigma factor